MPHSPAKNRLERTNIPIIFLQAIFLTQASPRSSFICLLRPFICSMVWLTGKAVNHQVQQFPHCFFYIFLLPLQERILQCLSKFAISDFSFLFFLFHNIVSTFYNFSKTADQSTGQTGHDVAHVCHCVKSAVCSYCCSNKHAFLHLVYAFYL